MAKVSRDLPLQGVAMAQTQFQDVQLYRMDLPEHACPWGLKARQLLLDQGIPFTDHRLTSEAEVQAFKAQHQVPTTPQIFSGGERIGGYTDLAARLQVKAQSADYSYTPVLAVFGTALLVDAAIGGGVMGFMGLALAMLAMLKLMDVAAFATSFLKYDLLSQRWPAYARLYPGFELLVALGFLAGQAQTPTGLLALVLGLSGMVSVYKAVVIDKLALNCACVGGNSKAPLGVVSFAENLMMAAMGAALLLQLPGTP
jgi:glutaredoxin